MSEPWKRKEVIGDCTLYLGDCLEILPELDKAKAVITDPPFNSGREAIQNDDMSDADWIAFCDKFSAVLNADNILVEVGKGDARMRQSLDRIHRYRWAICLNYTNAMRQGAVGYSNTGLILWYGEGKCHSRYMDRIDAPLENTVGEFSHPSPKTTAHYARLVDMFSKKGDTVVDPFMGSGTTGIACMKLGRDFVGIDIEEKYFDVACSRLERAYSQPDMFNPSENPPKQVGMEF